MSDEIPIAEARRIGETYDKTHVVIIALDERTGSIYATSFGLRDERDKLSAAALADTLLRIIAGRKDEPVMISNEIPPGPIQREAERRGFNAACEAIADQLGLFSFFGRGLDAEASAIALSVARDAVYRVRDAQSQKELG